MAREYARVKVGIWADTDFRHLSDQAQSLYFRLITSPTMNLAGVADWRPKRLAALTAGMTPKAVEKAADELAAASYVVVDDDTEEVLVRSFIRHDGLIKTPNIAAAMVKDYAGVASERIRGVIIHELHRLFEDDPEMKGWSVASRLLSEPRVDPSVIPSGNPSPNPSGNPSGMAYPNPSGTGSHIPQPSTLNQQPTTTPDGAGLFEEFWSIYPKRTGKGDAAKAFVKAIKRVGEETVMEGVRRLAADPNLPEKQYIPNPSTWLNQDRWTDDPYPPRVQPQGPQQVSDRGTSFWDRGVA